MTVNFNLPLIPLDFLGYADSAVRTNGTAPSTPVAYGLADEAEDELEDEDDLEDDDDDEDDDVVVDEDDEDDDEAEDDEDEEEEEEELEA